MDQDIVELSNLQRQPLYLEKDVGRPKVEIALEKLRAQNSGTDLRAHDTFLVRENALEILEGYDLVIDASDNFSTRYLVNDACVILKKPFISGALHGFEGQVSVFNYKGGPTYRCLYPDMPGNDEIPDCNRNGVLGVIPGIIGTIQALEAVKVLAGVGDPLSGKLLLFNGLDQSSRIISFEPDPQNLARVALEPSYGELSCKDGLRLNAAAFRELLAAGRPLQLIDVRTALEFDAGHLPEARHIPLNELEARLDEIDPNRPVFFICQTGKRSQNALEQLKTSFPQREVYSIDGGLDKYRRVCL
jgi:adenylyltransferase/sulfurtransferase